MDRETTRTLTRRGFLGRVAVVGLALVLVVAGWPLSEYVSQFRIERFSPDPAVATAAKDQFGPWHFVSLLLNFVTTCLAGVGLALAAKLPSAAPTGDGKQLG